MLLSFRMSLYCVHVEKEEGRLIQGEVAITLGMIDDAVQAVMLDDKITDQRLKDFTKSHYKTTFETWSKIDAELDTVKTLYSSSSFVYLIFYFIFGARIIFRSPLCLWENLGTPLCTYMSMVGHWCHKSLFYA